MNKYEEKYNSTWHVGNMKYAEFIEAFKGYVCDEESRAIFEEGLTDSRVVWLGLHWLEVTEGIPTDDVRLLEAKWQC